MWMNEMTLSNNASIIQTNTGPIETSQNKRICFTQYY